MPIMEDSLPRIKTFLSQQTVSSHVRLMVIRFMISILMRHGRNSCMNAAAVIDGNPCHRAQPMRFLRRYRHAIMDLLGQLVIQLLKGENWQGEYLLLVDSTMVGQQGNTAENTYSTGNRQRRPAKNRRYSKYKHARRSCHLFVFGLLITPSGVRTPFWRPYYSRRYAKAKRIKHYTQAALAAEMIRSLPVPDQTRVVVLGDTAFDAKIVREACHHRGFVWIVPVNANRVFRGAKGKRPRVSSQSINCRKRVSKPFEFVRDRDRTPTRVVFPVIVSARSKLHGRTTFTQKSARSTVWARSCSSFRQRNQSRRKRNAMRPRF